MEGLSNSSSEKRPPSLFLPLDIRPLVKALSPDQAGYLFVALLDYGVDGNIDNLPTNATQALFDHLKIRISKDIENYQKKSKARSENGKKGGAPKGNKNAAKKGSVFSADTASFDLSEYEKGDLFDKNNTS